MNLLLSILFAGSFTIVAPCTITILPLTISSVICEEKVKRAVTFILSASISILIFTLLLKSTTTLIFMPDIVWRLSSGFALGFAGLTFISDKIWHYAAIGRHSDNPEAEISNGKAEFLRIMIMGAAIGPVFNTCSPIYSYLAAAVIPENFIIGLKFLTVFMIGFTLVFLIVAIISQILGKKLNVKRTIPGIILMILAVGIIFGLDKELEALILEKFIFSAPFQYEQGVLEHIKKVIETLL